MIKIGAEIQIVGDSNAISNMYGDFSDKDNNVSSGLAGTFEHENNTKKLFLLSGDGVYGSKLSDGCIYSEQQISYYISQNKYSNSIQQSEEYGSGYQIVNTGGNDSYIVIYVKRTSGSTATSAPITIVFDEKNNQYATRIYIEGIGYVINNSAVFSTTIPIGYFNKEIRIYSWSKPNSPVIITGMYESLYYRVNSSKMVSCEFELNGKPSAETPDFGIISNRGSIECVDYDGELLGYIDGGKFDSPKNVRFVLENTYDKTKQIISTFVTTSVDYDDDNCVANISVGDSLTKWQDIKDVRVYLEKEYTSSGSGSTLKYTETKKTMLDVYNKLVALTNSLTNNEFAFDTLASNISTYLGDIVVPNFFLKKDNLWAQWQKFCKATGLYLYINKSNQIVLASEYDLSIGA